MSLYIDSIRPHNNIKTKKNRLIEGHISLEIILMIKFFKNQIISKTIFQNKFKWIFYGPTQIDNLLNQNFSDFSIFEFFSLLAFEFFFFSNIFSISILFKSFSIIRYKIKSLNSSYNLSCWISGSFFEDLSWTSICGKRFKNVEFGRIMCPQIIHQLNRIYCQTNFTYTKPFFVGS